VDAATAQLSAAHYRQQLAIKAQMTRLALPLWRMWRGTSKLEWMRMMEATYPVLAAQHAVSAAAGARHFETVGAVQTGKRWTAELAPPLARDRVEASLTATALKSVYDGRHRGLSLEAAKQVGFVRFSGSLTRLALEGGRDAVLLSVDRAGGSVGWTRVTSGKACAFCAGLAHQESAPEAFQAHDHCSCTATPLFR
jgi:hypothetical protein